MRACIAAGAAAALPDKASRVGEGIVGAAHFGSLALSGQGWITQACGLEREWADCLAMSRFVS